eukprot:5672766-Alexandrium_andersonii.AAC.1
MGASRAQLFRPVRPPGAGMPSTIHITVSRTPSRSPPLCAIRAPRSPSDSGPRARALGALSLIHISEPTRLALI